MTSIDAVKAGGKEAYQLLANFRNTMNPTVTQGAGATTKPEENGLFESMVTGINELVTQGREKGANVLEIGLAALTGNG